MTTQGGALARSDSGGDSLPDWLQPFTEGFLERGGNYEQESEPETLLLVVLARRQRPNERKPTSTHNVFTNFPRDPNCETCRPRPRVADANTGLTCAGIVWNLRRHSMNLSPQITTSYAKKTNQGCNNAAQWSCMISARIGLRPIQSRTNAPATRRKYHSESCFPLSNPEEFVTNSSCEDSVWNHDTSTPRRSETSGRR